MRIRNMIQARITRCVDFGVYGAAFTNPICELGVLGKSIPGLVKVQKANWKVTIFNR